MSDWPLSQTDFLTSVGVYILEEVNCTEQDVQEGQVEYPKRQPSPSSAVIGRPDSTCQHHPITAVGRQG